MRWFGRRSEEEAAAVTQFNKQREEEKVESPVNDQTENTEFLRPETFEHKLYLARDVEGRPNHSEIEIIKQLKQRLSQVEGFIGISPFGSVVRGHGNDSSDIDLYILYDAGLPTANDDRERIAGICQDFANQTSAESKHIQFEYWGINTREMVNEIRSIHNKPSCQMVAMRLAPLTRLVTGKKVEGYREIIRQELQPLSLDIQEEIINYTVHHLSWIDELSIVKRKDRLEHLTQEDHQQICVARKEMWRKRINKIWNIGETKEDSSGSNQEFSTTDTDSESQTPAP